MRLYQKDAVQFAIVNFLSQVIEFTHDYVLIVAWVLLKYLNFSLFVLLEKRILPFHPKKKRKTKKTRARPWHSLAGIVTN